MAKRGNGEGSIYRRNDGRWVGEMTIEGRQRKFIYGKTRKVICWANRNGFYYVLDRVTGEFLHEQLSEEALVLAAGARQQAEDALPAHPSK